MSEFYVYIHIRGDDGLPFYVGKGSGRRAYNTKNRTEWWKRVAGKHGRIVLIVRDNLTEAEAFTLEVHLIKELREKYPETLINLTDGGEGVRNTRRTEQQKDEIKQFIERVGRLPKTDNDAEKVLNNRMNAYCNKHHSMYDREFSEFCLHRGHHRSDTNAKKREIIAFYQEHGVFPTRGGQESERRLHNALRSYTDPKHGCFDPVFDSEVRGLGYGKWKGPARRDRLKDNKQSVLDFVRTHGRRPSKRAKSQEERRIAIRMGRYVAKSSAYRDPDFIEELDMLVKVFEKKQENS